MMYAIDKLRRQAVYQVVLLSFSVFDFVAAMMEINPILNWICGAIELSLAMFWQGYLVSTLMKHKSAIAEYQAKQTAARLEMALRNRYTSNY